MKKRRMHLTDLSLNKKWTLFLDRDGVINERLVGDYVKDPGEFKFIDGVPEAIAKFSSIFGRIIIVTNQQGIGKGIMTVDDLTAIHEVMVSQIERVGGRIDNIYFCPHLAKENSPCRKPNTGMAIMAQEQYPEIDFSRSIMIGDGLHDMEFGRRLGMITVFLGDDHPGSEYIDHQLSSLSEFASIIPHPSSII
jgi:histidinol-phosphate phosphatase family protein